MAGVGGITAGVLGIKSITQVYDETLKLVNLSERWNLPVEKVSQFANAFAQFGGDADSAIGMIEKLQQAANSLRFESSGPLKDLSAIMGTNLFNKDYLGAIKALRSEFRTLNENAQVTDDAGNIHIADISLRTMEDGSLIMDLAIDDEPQFYGRRCINRMPLILNQVIPGNLYFYDLFGNSNPNYNEFNDRYLLVYDTEYRLR